MVTEAAFVLSATEPSPACRQLTIDYIRIIIICISKNICNCFRLKWECATHAVFFTAATVYAQPLETIYVKADQIYDMDIKVLVSITVYTAYADCCWPLPLGTLDFGGWHKSVMGFTSNSTPKTNLPIIIMVFNGGILSPANSHPIHYWLFPPW